MHKLILINTMPTPILMLAISMIISMTIILMIITTTATTIMIMDIKILPLQILKHKQQEIKRINSRCIAILMITVMITMDMIIVTTIIIIMIIRKEKSVHMPRQPERKNFNKWDSKENYQILMIIVMQIVKTSMYN